MAVTYSKKYNVPLLVLPGVSPGSTITRARFKKALSSYEIDDLLTTAAIDLHYQGGRYPGDFIEHTAGLLGLTQWWKGGILGDKSAQIAAMIVHQYYKGWSTPEMIQAIEDEFTSWGENLDECLNPSPDVEMRGLFDEVARIMNGPPHRGHGENESGRAWVWRLFFKDSQNPQPTVKDKKPEWKSIEKLFDPTFTAEIRKARKILKNRKRPRWFD